MTALRVLLAALAAAPAAAVAQTQPPTVVVLQGLDKVTARITTLEVAVGSSVRFGTLDIRAEACRKKPPDEPPESAAFLRIDERRPGESSVWTFSGWMFASSPALSALEHPVYDVWVLDCKNASSSASDRSR